MTPRALHAERAVLGGLLLDGTAETYRAIGLSPESFGDKRHALTCRALETLTLRGEPADFAAVVCWLEAQGVVELAGGRELLSAMIEQAPSPASLATYAKAVKTEHRRRLVRDACSRALDVLTDADADPDTALRIIAEQTATAPGTGYSGRPTRHDFQPLGQVASTCTAPEWLVRDYLERGTFGLVYGDPGVGKSLLAADLALCVATGTPWRGHRVRQGAVFVLTGEGSAGWARRARAWSIRNGADITAAPIWQRPTGCDLGDRDTARAIGEAVRALSDAAGLSPVLVVVDTVARHMVGDENSTADMSRFVGAIGEQVIAATGANVLGLHHTGHADKGRPRGSMALPAAVDAHFALIRDEATQSIRLRATKQKDAELPPEKAFRIRGVDLGFTDADGREVTSAVLDECDPSTIVAPASPGAGLGANQREALATLRRLTSEQGARLADGGFDPSGARVHLDDWRAASGIDRRRWSEVVNALSKSGHVRIEHPYVSTVVTP